MGSEESRRESWQAGDSFEDAVTVFADPLARIFPDEEHSVTELRENHYWSFRATAANLGKLHGH